MLASVRWQRARGSHVGGQRAVSAAPAVKVLQCCSAARSSLKPAVISEMLSVASYALGLNVGTAPTMTAARATPSMMVKPLFIYDAPNGPCSSTFAANMGDSAHYFVQAGKSPTAQPRIVPATPKSQYTAFVSDAYDTLNPKPLDRSTPVPPGQGQ